MTTAIDKAVITDDEIRAFIRRVLADAPPLTEEKRDYLTRILSHA